MGHSIPVFFFSVDRSVCVPSDASWWDSQDLIGEAVTSGRVWQDTSRNWWHVSRTVRIADALGINDLSFLESECACLPAASLAAVDSAIEKLLQHIRGTERLPVLAGDYEYELVTARAHASQIDAAGPVRDNNCTSDREADDALCYYSFLRSLQAAVAEARATSSNLLIVQPQP